MGQSLKAPMVLGVVGREIDMACRENLLSRLGLWILTESRNYEIIFIAFNYISLVRYYNVERF